MKILTELLASGSRHSVQSSQHSLEFSREVSHQLSLCLAFFPSFSLQLGLFNSLLQAAFQPSSKQPVLLSDSNRPIIKLLLEKLCVRLTSASALVVSVRASPACRLKRQEDVKLSQQTLQSADKQSDANAVKDQQPKLKQASIDWQNGTPDCLCELTAAIVTGIDVIHHIEISESKTGAPFLPTADLRTTIVFMLVAVLNFTTHLVAIRSRSLRQFASF